MVQQVTPTLCSAGWIARLAYLKSAPDVRARHKAEYERHLHACPVCRAHFDALTEWARAAVMPEVEL